MPGVWFCSDLGWLKFTPGDSWYLMMINDDVSPYIYIYIHTIYYYIFTIFQDVSYHLGISISHAIRESNLKEFYIHLLTWLSLLQDKTRGTTFWMVLYKIDTQAKKYLTTKLKSCHYKIEISEIKEFEEKTSSKNASTCFPEISIL